MIYLIVNTAGIVSCVIFVDVDDFVCWMCRPHRLLNWVSKGSKGPLVMWVGLSNGYAAEVYMAPLFIHFFVWI